MTLSGQDSVPQQQLPPEPPWWRSNRFPFFFSSRLISQIGDMAAVAAIAIHVYLITKSGFAVGLFFLVRVLPRTLGTFAGTIGDRTELRRLMICCDLVGAVVFGTIAVADPGFSVLLVLIFVAESAATISAPASSTMVGRTVRSEHLATANGLLLTAISIGFAAGTALGGFAGGSGFFRWALAADAASFVISALLLSRLPTATPEPRTRPDRGFFTEAVAGLSIVGTDRVIASVTIGLVGVAFAASMDRPALIVLVEQNLHSSGLIYGLVLGVIAIGALLASLSAVRAKVISRRSAALFSAGIAGQAVGHLAMGLAPAAAVLLSGAVVAGFGNGLENVCANTLLQRTAPKESLGTLMGMVMSASYIANAVGSLVGGVFVDLIHARWTFVAAASVIAACGLMRIRWREK